MTQTVTVPGVGDLSFPDGMSQPDMAAAIQKNFPQIHAPAASAPAPESTADKFLKYPAAYAETGEQLTSGVAAGALGGIAGIGQGIKNFFDRDPSNMSAADRSTQVQNALTFQPKTDLGQKLAGVYNYLPQKLGQGADVAGQTASNITGSPAIGAAVNTAIQSAPALLMKAAGKVGAPVASATTPVELAKNYVATRTGLDWNALSDKVKATLTSVASDSTALQHLDPKAFEAQAKLESLPVPVPATAGQLSRDPVQLRNEGNVSATQAGKPIRDIYVAQNKALLDNLDVLKNSTGGTADSASQVGTSVQDQALRAKLAAANAQVKSLYKAAQDSGETAVKVDVGPIQQLINSTPDQSHYGYAKAWIDQNAEKIPGTRDSIANLSTKPATQASINDLEDLRKAAVAKGSNGGEDAYYAGKLKSAIDQATAGAGGEMYKTARAAYMAKEQEFSNQGAVARLVEQKAGRPLDRATALENTWNSTVLNGSAEDLGKVRSSLLTGGTPETQAAGAQAWKDLQAQTLQHIRDESTKGVARFEDGTPNVTPAAMERAIRSVGQQKLAMLFGPGTVAKLNAVMEATRTVKTEPPTGFKGSPTFANMLSFLEKSMISKIPVVGDTAIGVVKAAANLHDLGKTSRAVNAASQTPLGAASEEANSLSRKRSRNSLAGTALALDQNRLNQ